MEKAFLGCFDEVMRASRVIIPFFAGFVRGLGYTKHADAGSF